MSFESDVRIYEHHQAALAVKGDWVNARTQMLLNDPEWHRDLAIDIAKHSPETVTDLLVACFQATPRNSAHSELHTAFWAAAREVAINQWTPVRRVA